MVIYGLNGYFLVLLPKLICVVEGVDISHFKRDLLVLRLFLPNYLLGRIFELLLILLIRASSVQFVGSTISWAAVVDVEVLMVVQADVDAVFLCGVC